MLARFSGTCSTRRKLRSLTSRRAVYADIRDPMSRKPFVWDRNNPIGYSDPSGYCPICVVVAVPVVEIGVGDALLALGAGVAGGALVTQGNGVLALSPVCCTFQAATSRPVRRLGGAATRTQKR